MSLQDERDRWVLEGQGFSMELWRHSTNFGKCFKATDYWHSANELVAQIEGVFDPNPEICKAVRQAAKFLSAEEEAEQRKLELSNMKAKRESDPEPATEVAEEPEKIQLQQVGHIDISLYAAVVDSKTYQMPSTPISRKRHSILDGVNQDMVNTLNKMFSPENPRATLGSPSFRSPGANTRRATIMSPKLQANDSTTDEKKEVKTTQSKLLQVST